MNEEIQQPAQMQPQRYSKLAIWGFVLAIAIPFISPLITLVFNVSANLLGISSFLLGLIYAILIFSLPIVALILSISGLVAIKRHNLKGKWMAITALIISIITILLAVFLVLIYIQMMKGF